MTQVKRIYTITADPLQIKGFGASDVQGPVIPCGSSAQSDNRIREIGNVLYDPTDTGEEYKMLYTGWRAGIETDEKIHYAYSSDGKSWTKYASNPIISARAEDPYLLKVGSTYYLYVEDKANQGATGKIRRYSSSNMTTWADDGQCTGLDNNAQSPVVWKEGSTWYLIYEQAPAFPQDTRLATSADGLAWTPDASNPVFDNTNTTWVQSPYQVVPDDVIKIDSTYYLMYHGQSGSNYSIGIASSTDLTSWTDSPKSPLRDFGGLNPVVTATFLNDGSLKVYLYEEFDQKGIFRGFPISSEVWQV